MISHVIVVQYVIYCVEIVRKNLDHDQLCNCCTICNPLEIVRKTLDHDQSCNCCTICNPLC